MTSLERIKEISEKVYFVKEYSFKLVAYFLFVIKAFNVMREIAKKFEDGYFDVDEEFEERMK